MTPLTQALHLVLTPGAAENLEQQPNVHGHPMAREMIKIIICAKNAFFYGAALMLTGALTIPLAQESLSKLFATILIFCGSVLTAFAAKTLNHATTILFQHPAEAELLLHS